MVLLLYYFKKRTTSTYIFLNFSKVDEIKMTESKRIGMTKEEEGVVMDTNEQNGSVTVWQSMTSPLYLFELLYMATFQLKIWYYLSALADDLIRLTNNDKDVGKFIMFMSVYFQQFKRLSC